MAQKVVLDHKGEQDGEQRRVVLNPECEKEMEQLLLRDPASSQRLSGLVAEWRGETIEIHFAPNPAPHRESVAAPAVQEAPRRARRKVRVDWYQWGILLLMLSSAAVAVIRLLGAAPR